jgi:hypothetical protein
MADFGSCWGWQIDYYNDGTDSGEVNTAGHYQTDISNDIETAKISPVLARAIYKWQAYFEIYAYDDYCAREEKDFANTKMDWDAWNKAGIRLAHLLKTQIGHLFDEFYYDYAIEDKDFQKVWKLVESLKIK